MQLVLKGALGAAALCLTIAVHADAPLTSLPKGLMFVGLTTGEWRLFVAGEVKPAQVRTASEPRTPAYSLAQRRVAYVSDRGAIREIALDTGEDSILLEAKPQQAYTQLTYRPGTDELYAVLLHQGSSIDTDLARVDRSKRTAAVVSRQRSAQFEPTFTKDGTQLIYSNVLCASECPKIIQELWSMELVGKIPRQLTLLNSVSRQAAADGDGRIVFSSNREGYYQLWRLDAPDATPYRLTQERAVDESPVANDLGDVFFIRRNAAGGRLMRLDASGEESLVALDPAISDVRDLRLGR